MLIAVENSFERERGGEGGRERSLESGIAVEEASHASHTAVSQLL